jgi:hypothetical protein
MRFLAPCNPFLPCLKCKFILYCSGMFYNWSCYVTFLDIELSIPLLHIGKTFFIIELANYFDKKLL